MLMDFIPRTDKVKKDAFRARGMELKDAWYLGMVATDPDHEGRGVYTPHIRCRTF